MAAVAPPADQATDLLQKLSLDPKKKTQDSAEATKKSPADGGDMPNLPIPYDRSVTPLLQEVMDQSTWYPSMSYYYGGYEGAINEWQDYPRYSNHDGVEMPPPGVYGDIYHCGYGYATYGAYPSPGSPVPAIGHDGQLYGTHQYQYPSAYYQQPTLPASQNNAASAKNPNSQAEVSTSAGSEQPLLSVDSTKASSNAVANCSIKKNSASTQKSTHQHSTITSNGHIKNAFSTGLTSPGYPDMRFGFDAGRSPVPWVDGPGFTDTLHRSTANRSPSTGSHASSNRSQIRPVPHVMALNAQRPSSDMGTMAPVYLNRLYPNSRMYGQYGNALKNGLGFGWNGFDSRMNGCCGVAVDGKYKPRLRGNVLYGYGNENMDGLSELNRGPRSGRFKNQKVVVSTVNAAAKVEDLASSDNRDGPIAQDKDKYNHADFPVQYADARFFVIKSYSEDDIHKSVKYGVWASTPNGNKKLDASYQEAQVKEGGCPVFLFFSVNTSGQFVGVAEMVGPVNYNKTVEYWQQDKWNGCFPVKWHIVKDVPNSALKHITLEYNDNKPVTNSRDTQEVKLEQGLQLLKIFKDHVSKTSVLDDFGFYEMRQKVMQEKKAKQQQLQKQMPFGKTSDPSNEKEDYLQTAKPKLQKPLEGVSLLKKDVQGGLTERNAPEGNGVAAVIAVPNVTKLLPKGIVNGC